MIKEYGSWQQAKLILDGISEPRITVTKEDRGGMCINLAPILEYPVQYCKRITKNGIKAKLVIMNPFTNGCYMRDLSEITAQDVKDILN